MKSILAKVIFYCVLAICTTVISISMYSITQGERTISTTINEKPIIRTRSTVNQSLPASEAIVEEPKISGLAVTIAPKSELFFDRDLEKNLKPTADKFTFNEILSQGGDKIVYAELSNCSEGKPYWNGCPWEYSIKIFDGQKKNTATLYRQTNDRTSDTYMHGIIYYPIAWSKNDKKIILGWYNLYEMGQGGLPSAYALLDLNGGKFKFPGAFANCSVTIFDNNTQAVTATDRNGNFACAEGEDVTPEKIIVTNAETEKTVTVVGRDKGFGHAIKSFDPLTRTLIYITFPCIETAAGCIVPQNVKTTTQELKI